MAKHEYPAWHYLVAAAMAMILGAVYTFATFHPLLGPGLLAAGAAFLVVGVRKRRREMARPAAALAE